MLWLPTLSVEVFRAAVPPVSVTAVPRLLAPSLNWTVPVGVPAPGETALTVAVKVRLSPDTDGFSDDAMAVVVDALPTTWLKAAEVLVAKAVSPAYTAVTLCVATFRDDVVKVVWPPVSVPVPRVDAPSLNVTIPVAALGDTAAVKVTDWPKTDGFGEDASVVVLVALTTWLSALEVLVLKLVSPL